MPRKNTVQLPKVEFRVTIVQNECVYSEVVPEDKLQKYLKAIADRKRYEVLNYCRHHYDSDLRMSDVRYYSDTYQARYGKIIVTVEKLENELTGSIHSST